MTRFFGALGDLFRGPPLDIGWLTPCFALGVAPSVHRLHGIERLGLTSILELRPADDGTRNPRRTLAAVSSRLDVETLPFPEGAAPTLEHLERGSRWTLDALAADRRVLICSHDGGVASAILASAVLVRVGYPLSDALFLVRACRSAAAPTDPQLAALRAFSSLAALRAFASDEVASGHSPLEPSGQHSGRRYVSPVRSRLNNGGDAAPRVTTSARRVIAPATLWVLLALLALIGGILLIRQSGVWIDAPEQDIDIQVRDPDPAPGTGSTEHSRDAMGQNDAPAAVATIMPAGASSVNVVPHHPEPSATSPTVLPATSVSVPSTPENSSEIINGSEPLLRGTTDVASPGDQRQAPLAVQIISPSNGQHVPEGFVVGGKRTGTQGLGEHLWILIQPRSESVPQYQRELIPDATGSWVLSDIPLSGPPGSLHHLVVGVIDEGGHQAVSRLVSDPPGRPEENSVLGQFRILARLTVIKAAP